MNYRSIHAGLALMLAGGAIVFGANASAEGQGSASRAQVTTQTLNAGPAQSTLPPRPTVAPPWAAGSQPARARTLDDALAGTGSSVEAPPAGAPAASGVTLAAGETEPPPIPVTLGYYVRGDKDCDQVWPGDGDLAWMTPTTFTIDYGGCEPGQFLQTGPNSWREDQRCITESGGDAGGYSVTYEVIGTDTVMRTARLALDGSVEADLWRHCPTDTLSENARFMS